MSLDDLITLLLVVLFVGAPLLQRLLRGGSGSQQPGEGGEADRDIGDATSGEGRSAREAAESGGRSTRAERTDSSDATSELERRIEEARRRVREAREGSRSGQATTPTTTRQAASASARSDDRDSSRPLVAQRESQSQSPSTGFLGREGITRQPTQKAPPLQVLKRKPKGAAARLAKERVVSLDARNILQGIVWHQILSERVGKRAPRRQPSRDR